MPSGSEDSNFIDMHPPPTKALRCETSLASSVQFDEDHQCTMSRQTFSSSAVAPCPAIRGGGSVAVVVRRRAAAAIFTKAAAPSVLK